jgi:glycine/D-amino acid oxidase-like deaminating enzyme
MLYHKRPRLRAARTGTAMSASDAYGNSWYAATMAPAPERPQLTSDLDIDVCVVGGGLAGLTAAREVARRGWSVALLEAGRIAAGASGRNTGFVLPGFAAEPDDLIGRVGFAHARDLWALSESGLDYVRAAIGDDAMTGVDVGEGWLYVSKLDDGDAFLRLMGVLGEFGCEIEGWPTERVRAVLRSEHYFHAIHFPRAIHIHPLNYALGLARAAERDGARIFEHTPVAAIDPAGVRKRIVTPAARLRATHVVLCGNVQIGGLMPALAATLLPVTTYVLTTAPLGPRLDAAIGYRGAVTDTDLADNHYRIVGGDRLMWSGRMTTWARNPRRYLHSLKADLARTFPQLEGVDVAHIWSGTLGNTIHRMPQLGELGPGVWLASGFGGHGLNTTAMAGNLIARAIVEGDQTWRLFAPFELIRAGGALGRGVVQVLYWVKRVRDAAEERRARARDAVRRRGRQEVLAEAAPAPAAAAAEPRGSESAARRPRRPSRASGVATAKPRSNRREARPETALASDSRPEGAKSGPAPDPAVDQMQQRREKPLEG